tara:strand:+ start:27 stop:380 length:354 start_codon:yes stop_codon:yes gene_type:complete
MNVRLYKFFIITISITSFFYTSVLSNSISFCKEKHGFEKLVNKKFHDVKSSCHTDIKDKMKKQFCVECDCYLTQVLSNISFENSSINFFKNNFADFLISYHPINYKVKGPPPKNYSS